MIGAHAIAFVDFAVTPQVRDDGKVTSTALGFAGIWLLACVAVHVCLQRAGTGEALIANLALVFLLCAGRDLGVELAHHGLRGWEAVVEDETARSWKGARAR